MKGFWNGRRVLVTGASGFIGAWLCRKLVDRNAVVHAIVHRDRQLLGWHGIANKVNCLVCDVRRARQVQRAFECGPELCFHLAAKSSTREAAKDLLETFNTNVVGTLNVLSASKAGGSAVVFVSSVKVYGGFTEKCFSEGDELRGTTAYAASKICGEAVCRMFTRSGLSVGIARPGNVFGGFDNNFSRLVPGAVKSLLDGKPPVILGGGESRLDMVYVEDVVEGLLLVGERALRQCLNAEPFNLGTGESHSVRAIVAEISRILGKRVKPRFEGEEVLSKECLCVEKAARVLGWRAKHGLHAGLRKTVGDFKRLLA